jgi:hypothetical protein
LEWIASGSAALRQRQIGNVFIASSLSEPRQSDPATRLMDAPSLEP